MEVWQYAQAEVTPLPGRSRMEVSRTIKGMLPDGAADSGDTGAMYRLAMAYEKGEGVDKDKEEAKKLYEKAADLGNVTAREKLESLMKPERKKIIGFVMSDPEPQKK